VDRILLDEEQLRHQRLLQYEFHDHVSLEVYPPNVCQSRKFCVSKLADVLGVLGFAF
jgi:hypothetical protein